MVDLIERLRNGVVSTGDLHDDNETELFHVDEASETMAEAADRIAALEAQLAEKAKVGDWDIEKTADDIARELAAIKDGRIHGDTYNAAKAGALAALKCASATLSALEATPPAPKVTEQDPDDEAVDRFAAAMKAKLAKKRAEGRGGWDNPAECSAGYLSLLLVEHIEKGDPLDVGNLAMMLHQRGDRIADERERYAVKRQPLTAALEAGKP